MTYQRVVEQLDALPIMPKSAPSLVTTQQGLQRLGLDTDIICKTLGGDLQKVILISGTNGKGSTGATLSHLLLQARQRVGFYSSPHLKEYRERIRIDDKPISPDLFAQAFEFVTSSCAHLALTHFEILTLMAASLYFLPRFGIPPVDYAIFEVGLGGTWDATNAIPHGTCLITQIDFDHQHILGDTLEEIARNKFGIVPKRNSYLPTGAQVLHFPFDLSLRNLQKQVQEQTQSHWEELLPFAMSWQHQSSSLVPKCLLHSPWGEGELALIGERGAQNSMLALMTMQALGYDPACSLEHLKTVNWPGRMQKLTLQQMEFFISGDHNPAGIKSLIQLLKGIPYQKLYCLVGVGEKKDLDEMMLLLEQIPRIEVAFTSASFQGRTQKQYAPWSSKYPRYYATPLAGIEALLAHKTEKDLVLMTGSLYLIGDLFKQANLVD